MATCTDGLIQRIAVLEEDECDAIRDRLQRLRDHWVLRDGVAFHTLGAALYLDAPVPETVRQFGLREPEPDGYEEKVRRCNPLLREWFSPLYDKLEAALSRALGVEARFATGRGLPGFQIYGPAAAYSQQASHVPHYDRQYECIDWSEHPGIDFTQAISITLPIRLPARGGGLRVWELDLFEVQALPRAEAKERARRAPWKIYPYRAGELVCHRGHLLHQIATWSSVPDDERITLQGHGLYFDGCWNLYW